MNMPDRQIPWIFHIDANRINASGKLEHVNRLEKWRKDGVILLGMSETAQSEAAAGESASRKEKAYSYVYSMTMANTEKEKCQIRRIEEILFPEGAKAANEMNDVEIVFNALKYGAILITNDGGSRSQPRGILGNRDALGAMGVRIMRDDEAVSYIGDLILKRDEHAKLVAEITAEELPDWVGRD